MKASCASATSTSKPFLSVATGVSARMTWFRGRVMVRVRVRARVRVRVRAGAGGCG